MRLPFFTLIVVFVIYLTAKIKLSDRQVKNSKEDFLDKEVAANNTRRKSLDDLDYITIPFDELPLCNENEKSFEYYQKLKGLSTKKIVNLTGISNTDLKLQYGVANLEALSEYDRNFTELSRMLYLLGKELFEAQNYNDAKKVFEFAVSCKCDISGIYTMLSQIYSENNDKAAIEHLICVVNELDSLMKNSILKKIKNINL